jgi:hypothetical protein
MRFYFCSMCWLMKKLITLLALAFFLQVSGVSAQCPMCKMSAEADLKNGGSTAAGLNRGILYLLAIPYLMIGGIGYLWWRNRRALAEEEQERCLRALLEEHNVSLSDGTVDEL